MEGTEQITLLALLRYLRNFFPGQQWHFDGTPIRGGQITLPGLEIGDYYLIEGSRRNDGIHIYGENGLKDEIFTGTVTELCIPDEIVALQHDINTWIDKNAAVIESPYTSESFGGYSYTKSGGSAGVGGSEGIISWKTVFAPRLRQWRKL